MRRIVAPGPGVVVTRGRDTADRALAVIFRLLGTALGGSFAEIRS